MHLERLEALGADLDLLRSPQVDRVGQCRVVVVDMHPAPAAAASAAFEPCSAVASSSSSSAVAVESAVVPSHKPASVAHMRASPYHHQVLAFQAVAVDVAVPCLAWVLLAL